METKGHIHFEGQLDSLLGMRERFGEKEFESRGGFIDEYVSHALAEVPTLMGRMMVSPFEVLKGLHRSLFLDKLERDNPVYVFNHERYALWLEQNAYY